MMDEEAFVREIAGLFPAGPGVIEGIGDDCAVLEIPGAEDYLLAAVDQVVEGVHYLSGTPPEKIAAKLVRRNVSDIAAMGGRPAFAMLSLALPEPSSPEVMAFHRAVKGECGRFGISVIGGDVSGMRAKGSAVHSLSILGFVERSRMKTRSGAKAGDVLCSTGRFGKSFETGYHLDFEPKLNEGRILSANPSVHAMMDVSDGLLKDALRMAAASNLSLELNPSAVPRRDGADEEQALCDGEDYALIFAVSPDFFRKAPAGVPIARIGTFLPGNPGRLLNDLKLKRKGFDHFHHE